ncbi:hypothetical protein DMUE_0878, partial [Dictyocoela muelleri]
TIIRISCVVSGLLLQNENVRLFSSVIYVLHILPVLSNIKPVLIFIFTLNYIASFYYVFKNDNHLMICASLALNLIFYLIIIIGLVLSMRSNDRQLCCSESENDKHVEIVIVK